MITNERENNRWTIAIIATSSFLVLMVGHLPEQVAWYPYVFVDIATGLGIFLLLLRQRRTDHNLQKVAEALEGVESVLREKM